MLRYPALLLLLFAIGAPHAGNANPSQLWGVRFGWHGAYARVVFDVEENTSYRLRPGTEPTRILIEFPGIHSLPNKAVWRSRHPLVQSVRFSTSPTAITGELLLTQPGAIQRHFRMHAPPRIVLDITRQSSSRSHELTGAPKKQKFHQREDKRSTAKQEQQLSVPSTKPAASSPVAHGSQQKESNSPKARNPAEKTPALTRNQLLRLAERQWREGELMAAHQSYRRFMERFPDHKHNHFIAVRLADILQQRQQLREALEAYAAVITTYPGTEGAMISRMRMAELGAVSPDLLSDADDPQFTAYYHPVETLEEIIRNYALSPLANIARFKMGEIYLHRNELEAAFASFHQLLQTKLQPDLLEDAQRQIGKILQPLLAAKQQKGAFFEVLRTFFENQEYLAPEAVNHPDLLLPVAISYARLGLLPEAQSIFKSLINDSAAAKQKTTVALEQARILSKSGKIRAALDLLEPLVPVGDASMQGIVLQTVGELAIRAEHPAKAIGYLEMALDMASAPAERVRTLSLLADGYVAQGDTQRGLQTLQRCAELAGDERGSALAESESCRFRAASLLLAAGQAQQALDEYRALLQKFPETHYRDRMLFFIAEIQQEIEDEEQMVRTLQTLRDSSTTALWKKAATVAIEHHKWQNRFGDRLVELLDQSPQ